MRRWGERGAWWVAAASVLAPAFVALWLECTSGAAHALPDGDEAVIETRVLTLGRALPLVGAYSRYAWHHPGPLLFYALAPAYWLSGRSSAAIAVTAAAINAACLAACVALLFRLARGRWQRAATLGVLAMFVAYFGAFFLPTSYSTAWNPAIAVLPYGLLLLTSSALASGDTAFVVPCVVLHAFVAQCHVAYAFAGTASLGCAVLLALRRGGARSRRWWIAGAAVFVVLWTPPALDAAFGTGNLQAVLRFFARSRRAFSLGVGDAMRLLAWRATAPWRALWGEPNPDRPMNTGPRTWIVFAAGVALLPLAYARARAAGRSRLAALCAIVSVQAVVAALAMLRVDSPDQPYLTWWLAVVWAWGATASACALLPEAGRTAPRGLQKAAATGAGALVAALSLKSAAWVHDEYLRFARDVAVTRGPTVRMTRDLAPLFRCSPRLEMRVRQHELWGTMAGMLIKLDQADVWPVLDPSWRFMFGDGYAYRAQAAPALLLDERFVHDARLVGASPATYVYVEGDEPPAPRPAKADVRVVAASGTLGPLQGLVDGAAEEGSHWDSPGSVILQSAASSVTLRLPSRRVTELAVCADGNDDYVVEGSSDGVDFEPVATLPDVHGFGQRTRRVSFEHPRPWTYLRIRPGDGDGHYSLRQVSALVSDWDVQPIARPAAAAGDTSVSEFVLPSAPVDGLRVVTAKGSGSCRVEASLDGSDYVAVGSIPAGGGAQSFYFNDDEAWRTVRLTNGDRQSACAGADVTALVAPGVVVDVGSSGDHETEGRGWSAPEGKGASAWRWVAGASAELTMDGESGPEWEIAVSMAPGAPVDEPPIVTMDWDGEELARFELAPGAHTYRARLHASRGGTRHRLGLRFGRDAEGGARAVAVYRVVLERVPEALRNCAERDGG